MKVLLVNPPLQDDFPSTSCFMPLGLAVIAAVLRRAGMNVAIMDMMAENKKIPVGVTEIIAAEPDIVGITAMTPTYSNAARLAQSLKAANKNLKICCGGPHATLAPDSTLNDRCFDFVVRGEGELTFLELCKTVEIGVSHDNIAGLSFRNNGKNTHNPARHVINNLDSLPPVAYDFLSFENYQNRAPPAFVRKMPWISYCSSRGCPFGCRFCSTSKLWGRTWRGMSAARIMDDVNFLIERYHLRTLFFIDDNFTIQRERVLELCDRMVQAGIELEWICNCRVDQVDEELLSKMRAAGCWRIGFGIEAGTQKILDWYGKRITLDTARNAIKTCKNVGITQACYFIMGAPPETEADIRATIDFAIELDPDVVGFSYLTPFPGTRLYDESIENDWILSDVGIQQTLTNADDFRKLNQNKPIIKCGVSPERFVELNKTAYRKFYFRPSYILKQLKVAVGNPNITYRGIKSVLGWLRG